MPRDINGNTSPLPGTLVNTGDDLLPSQHNPMVNDLYSMMSQSLSRDGQGGMRAPLNMSGFRILNVGPATASTDAVSLSQFQTGTPIGTVVDFAGTSAPETWLLCFGQAVSRTTYADLFSVIGTTYGAGDGSTTFNVPDCRGRVIAGKDNMGGTSAGRLDGGGHGINGNTLGSAGGFDSHTLTVSQMPTHNHSGLTTANGAHTHGVPSASSASGATAISGSQPSGGLVQTTQSGTHQHTIINDGGGLAHPNVQPTIIMNKVIKVSY